MVITAPWSVLLSGVLFSRIWARNASADISPLDVTWPLISRRQWHITSVSWALRTPSRSASKILKQTAMEEESSHISLKMSCLMSLASGYRKIGCNVGTQHNWRNLHFCLSVSGPRQAADTPHESSLKSMCPSPFSSNAAKNESSSSFGKGGLTSGLITLISTHSVLDVLFKFQKRFSSSTISCSSRWVTPARVW